MLFNSFEYLIFYPVVACLYFIFPPRSRWMLLLAASYWFYMAWKPAYVVLLILSTLVDYVAALLIFRTASRGKRRLYLVLSLLCNLGLLFTFKYFNFLNASIRACFDYFTLSYPVRPLDLLLPVGISFYTFQSMSYTIDVYRGRLEPERHLGMFALYVSFFPQLVAGPIERAANLLPQLRASHRFDYSGTVEGLRLILWGMFKKVVIADWLAVLVDRVYGDPSAHSGPILTLATVCFAYQIYCDFSGYSDIAIGSARILGVRLMTNFDTPYLARSVPEFWHRWHISLSTWFRDYVYLPLGGNKTAVHRWCINLLVVFGLSGLWHGANWTFLAWGLLHAGFYLASRSTKDIRATLVRSSGLARLPRTHAAIQILFTFTLVCVGWVFFRAKNITDAVYVITHLHEGWGGVLNADVLRTVGRATLMSPTKLLFVLGAPAFLAFVEWLMAGKDFSMAIAKRSDWFRWAVYVCLALAIMNMGATQEVPFLYFQF